LTNTELMTLILCYSMHSFSNNKGSKHIHS